MAYECILVEKEDGVAILTMNRPDQLNAMNRQLSAELHDAVKQMEGDDAMLPQESADAYKILSASI